MAPCPRTLLPRQTAVFVASFHVRAEFAADVAAPLSTPLAVENGSLVIVQNDGQFSQNGGYLKNTDQSTPAAGDLYLRSSATVPRAAGQIVYAIVNVQAGSNAQIFGMNTNSTGSPSETQHVFRLATTDLQTRSGTITGVSAPTLPTGVDHELAIALRAAGAHFLERRSGESNWKHLYVGETATFSGYLTWAMGDNVTWADCLRVYDEATVSWAPTPLASDSFNGADGAASATSDGLGVEESGGGGVAWTDQSGTFDRNSNRLRAIGTQPAEPRFVRTLDAGEADVLVQCTVNQNTAGAGGNNPGIVLRYADGNNFWLVGIAESTDFITIWERNAGTWTGRGSVAVTFVAGTPARILAAADGTTIRAMSSAFGVQYTSATLNQTSTVHGVRMILAGDYVDDFAIFERFPSDFPAEVAP